MSWGLEGPFRAAPAIREPRSGARFKTCWVVRRGPGSSCVCAARNQSHGQEGCMPDVTVWAATPRFAAQAWDGPAASAVRVRLHFFHRALCLNCVGGWLSRPLLCFGHGRLHDTLLFRKRPPQSLCLSLHGLYLHSAASARALCGRRPMRRLNLSLNLQERSQGGARRGRRALRCGLQGCSQPLPNGPAAGAGVR